MLDFDDVPRGKKKLVRNEARASHNANSEIAALAFTIDRSTSHVDSKLKKGSEISEATGTEKTLINHASEWNTGPTDIMFEIRCPEQ